MILTGKYANVGGRANVRNWSLSQTQSVKQYVHSGTAGGTGRLPGISDWSGQFGVYSGADVILPLIGTEQTFTGYCGPAVPSAGPSSTGPTYSGPALLLSAALNWNWEAGDPFSALVNFSGNGLLSGPSNAVTTRSDLPMIDSNELAFYTGDYDDNDAEDDRICHMKSATFNWLFADKPFANSCTAGRMGRQAGASDFNLSIVFDGTDTSDLDNAKPGDYLDFSLMISPDKYLFAQGMLFRDISNINANAEGGEIIGFTANFDAGQTNPSLLAIRPIGSGSEVKLWETT
jgi:hypothetical protein